MGRERAGARGGRGRLGRGRAAGEPRSPERDAACSARGSSADARPARPRSLFLPAAYLGKGKGRGVEEGEWGRKDGERKDDGSRGF